MKFKKVIARKDLPARFPFGLAAFLLWIADKVESPIFYWLVMIGLFITAATVMLRQFSEKEVELKDLHDDSPTQEEEALNHN